MAAGTLAGAGYFLGDRLHPPRDGNPRGYFEDAEVNGINEAMLARVVPKRPRILGRFMLRDRPGASERWIARVQPGTQIEASAGESERIQALVERTPYCFKDPRFSYTLPAWRPYLGDAVYLCVFRDPMSTARSILKECRTSLKTLYIDMDRALEVWSLMYRHILDIHSGEGQWAFFHFKQFLTSDGLDRLARFTEAKPDRSFPDPALRRFRSEEAAPAAAAALYRRLCDRAGYEEV